VVYYSLYVENIKNNYLVIKNTKMCMYDGDLKNNLV